MAPRIYPFLPEYTPFFKNYMRPSQNIPLPPRIYPSFQKLYAILPNSTPPSQITPPPFQQLYATLPESTPPSQNLPSPSQNIPPFSTTIILCDPARIYPLSQNIPPLFNNSMRRSQNVPLFPRIYPPFQLMHIFDPPRIYPSLPRLYPPFQQLYGSNSKQIAKVISDNYIKWKLIHSSITCKKS